MRKRVGGKRGRRNEKEREAGRGKKRRGEERNEEERSGEE